MRSGRVAGVVVVVGIWSATGWASPGFALAETPGAEQGSEQGSGQGAEQSGQQNSEQNAEQDAEHSSEPTTPSAEQEPAPESTPEPVIAEPQRTTASVDRTFVPRTVRKPHA